MFEFAHGTCSVLSVFRNMLLLLLWLRRTPKICVKRLLWTVLSSVAILLIGRVLMLCVCNVLSMPWLELSEILCLVSLLFTVIVIWLKVSGLATCTAAFLRSVGGVGEYGCDSIDAVGIYD